MLEALVGWDGEDVLAAGGAVWMAVLEALVDWDSVDALASGEAVGEPRVVDGEPPPHAARARAKQRHPRMDAHLAMRLLSDADRCRHFTPTPVFLSFKASQVGRGRSQ